jgi:hypothetical protein
MEKEYWIVYLHDSLCGTSTRLVMLDHAPNKAEILRLFKYYINFFLKKCEGFKQSMSISFLKDLDDDAVSATEILYKYTVKRLSYTVEKQTDEAEISNKFSLPKEYLV